MNSDRRRRKNVPEINGEDLRKSEERRGGKDRRTETILSFRERLYEKASCLAIGMFLLFFGAFFIVTGLTFLPVLGIYVGLFLIVSGLAFMMAFLHS